MDAIALWKKDSRVDPVFEEIYIFDYVPGSERVDYFFFIRSHAPKYDEDINDVRLGGILREENYDIILVNP